MNRKYIALLVALGIISVSANLNAQAQASGRWYNAYAAYCPTFCSGIGQENVPSPEGYSCTSGEQRPWSAIYARVDYSPTGCWHPCQYPEGRAPAVSVSFRCYAPGQKQDNDITDTTVGCFCRPYQCGDGVDNDGDGVTDLADPGCSSVQDNNEGDGTTQCQDGRDNDGDGATDYPNDFSCASRTDNDETNPKSQCQDGVDNDGDGAIDLADFSCQNNRQRNDEANPKAQCQTALMTTPMA